MDADSVTRLRRVVGKLTRKLNESATEAGLTPTQASVLGLIAVRGPLGLADLIALERLNPTMLSRVIGKLDDAGLVSRLPNTEDQRTVRVEATADGARVHEGIKARRSAIVAACISELSPRQAKSISQALPALEALAEQLERSGHEHPPTPQS